MLKRAFSFFSSLRLTVACLCMALVLVFAGTLAQVQLGLWEAQTRYFHSFLVFWTPAGSNWKIPVWPGGYLLGWVLLINLLSAHAVRFKFTKKKAGIFLIHIGIILLLLGQFFTEMTQVESNLRLTEGETKNYSESSRFNELAIVDVTDPNSDEVVAIPESLLASKGEIRNPKLPFAIRVKEYFANTDPELVAPVVNPGAPRATHGIGRQLTFKSIPLTRKMDSVNIPAAQIEIVTGSGVESTWMVSSWITVPQFTNLILRQDQWASMLGNVLSEPQMFTHNGRTYEIAIRPVRYYKFTREGSPPYRIQLIDFRHDQYRGTGIAKNSSSLVRVQKASASGSVIEDREVLIRMNQPLRYGGETYYQGSFDPNDERVTILQVVRNPAWLTPYVACTLVGLGLTVQFLMHLVGFARRTSDKNKPAGLRPDLKNPKAKPEQRGRGPRGKSARPEAAVVSLPRTAEGRKT